MEDWTNISKDPLLKNLIFKIQTRIFVCFGVISFVVVVVVVVVVVLYFRCCFRNVDIYFDYTTDIQVESSLTLILIALSIFSVFLYLFVSC